MGITNIHHAVDRAINHRELWNYLHDIINYYLALRKMTQEKLGAAIGYSPASMAGLKGGFFTPEQIERIIVVLKIDDTDANRMRSKYWAAICGQHECPGKFNRLYADDAESTIRELVFERDKLAAKISIYEDLHPENKVAAEVSGQNVKKKP